MSIFLTKIKQFWKYITCDIISFLFVLIFTLILFCLLTLTINELIVLGDSSLYNIIYLLIGIAILCILWWIIIKVFKNVRVKRIMYSTKFLVGVIIVGSICLLFYQNYLINNINYISSVYDYALTLNKFCDSLFSNFWVIDDTYDVWFSHYNNFVFLTSLLFHFKNFMINLCMCDANTIYYICQLFVTLSIVSTTIFITLIVKKLSNNIYAIFSYFLSFLLLGLSYLCTIVNYWTYSIFFASFIIFLYICCNKTYIKWALIFFISIIGFYINRILIICFVSVLIIELIDFLKKKSWKCLKTSLCKTIKFVAVHLLLICVVSIVTITLCNFICNWGIKNNEETEFGVPHFLMTGANIDSFAQWNIGDYEISASSFSKQERDNNDMNIFIDRITNMEYVVADTDWCLADFFKQKITICFSEGTFIFKYPVFLSQLSYSHDNFISVFYDITDNVNKNRMYSCPYNIIAQIVWLLMLLGSVFCLIIYRSNKYFKMIALSGILLFVWVLFYECNVLDVFVYSGYFIISGSLGIAKFIPKLIYFIKSI